MGSPAARFRLGRGRALALAAPLLAAAGGLRAADLPPLSAPASMFRNHRDRLMAALPRNSIAIVHSAPERVFSNDTNYAYRQSSDFHYLTGLDEPDSTAVLRPAAPDAKRYVLFVRAHDPRREAYEGARPGPEGAVSRYAADAAFASSELENALARYEPATREFVGYLAGIDAVYVSDGGDAAWASKFRDALSRMRAREAGPASVVDAGEILHELRVVKDADEIALLRRASELSARAHLLAMKAAAPGRHEYEIQAALDGYCLANGAREMAYPSIVGSGPNSVFLHWNHNDREMKAGEVVLNDSGAEYDYYASDVTRTYPVSGRFSPEQRAIYEIVLAAQKSALALVKPGLPHEEIENACARAQAEGLVRLGLLSGDVEKIVKDRTDRRFTLHGVSHWVGLDVHDAGRYRVHGASRRLEPGMVFTIEPGIYVPANSAGVDRKWWNIGVRIEDTILVTPGGADCLSCAAPREVEDVERAVLSGRR